MTGLVVAIFVATYIGMVLGRVPGLKVDRTGIALMAVAVLLAFGATDIARAGQAIDGSVLTLLFALMIVSAQLGSGGFYDLCAARIAAAPARPVVLLAATVAVTGLLSAMLANDIVVFAMTPLLCTGLRARGLDPRPYLLAQAGASNAGSAATLIGNPQNILIGQVGDLDFWRFFGVCSVPAALALFCVFFSILWIWRRELAVVSAPEAERPAGKEANAWQIGKGLVATALLVALFATPVPREVGALTIAAVLLASRTLSSREMIGAVDWHLLLLFACLFVVTAAFADTGLGHGALQWLAARSLLPDALAVLEPLTLIASNTVGNVPTVMLFMALWPAPDSGLLYALALLSTLAGNLLIVGSIANLIVAERAASVGV